jgi:hypothetical protein
LDPQKTSEPLQLPDCAFVIRGESNIRKEKQRKENLLMVMNYFAFGKQNFPENITRISERVA